MNVFSTVPNVPGDVRMVDVSQNFIEIVIDAPSGTYNGFEISWRVSQSGSEPITTKLAQDELNYHIPDLSPSTTYEVTVYTTSGSEKSPGVTRFFSTSGLKNNTVMHLLCHYGHD